jgi:hypothetical protein
LVSNDLQLSLISFNFYWIALDKYADNIYNGKHKKLITKVKKMIQDLSDKVTIKVIVTIDGTKKAKMIGFDATQEALLGWQGIDDEIRDWVYDQWSDYAAERITKISWIYA